MGSNSYTQRVLVHKEQLACPKGLEKMAKLPYTIENDVVLHIEKTNAAKPQTWLLVLVVLGIIGVGLWIAKNKFGKRRPETKGLPVAESYNPKEPSDAEYE